MADNGYQWQWLVELVAPEALGKRERKWDSGHFN